MFAIGDAGRQSAEHVGIREFVACLQLRSNLIEDRPEHASLLFRQSSFSAQPGDITI
jgi:hypothetical protein